MNILIVEDDNTQRELLAGALKKEYNVQAVKSGESAVELLKDKLIDVVLLDLRLQGMDGIQTMHEIHKINPEIQVLIITAYASVEGAVEAIKQGAYDYITKPIDLTKLKLTIKRAIENKHLLTENRYLKEELKEKYRFDNIVGESKAIQDVLSQVARTAKTNATVLITGESGTGKELIARAIHYLSERRGKFVPVACAAIPETLIESELFGYEKGAFTGAQEKRKGKFELADEGTIFLDEVGDIPLHLQVKLLRVLQEQEVERLGSSECVKIDARIIAATNQNLEQKVKDRSFREDLYYRLNVIAINLPPLKDRKEDILPLVSHFLQKYSAVCGKNIEGVSKPAQELLLRYDWPGNVRELENAIERAIVMTRSTIIQPEDLPEKLLLLADGSGGVTTPLLSDTMSLSKIERQHIEKVLQATNWNYTRAAELLKIHRNTLRLKIKHLQINK